MNIAEYDETIQRRHFWLSQEVRDRYAHLNIPAIIDHNRRYVERHGIGERELERWDKTLKGWTAYANSHAKVPLPGDRIVLTAMGSISGEKRVYKNALIDGKHRSTGELSICTEPYVPWLHGVDSVAHIDVSGGYFGHLPAFPLRFREVAPALFQFWGTRPTADGSLYIQLPVHWWEVTTDKFC